ncbi:hypothetical protein JZ751_004940 [Albula glossodonta]|uniref:Uncharacterized protein n=1 Tax=Albula glossodonta TaxID=121402 RepID=A0A8T2P1U4_9TELE|nr:hypothetical protein JZ751_004940 [Albula glossodonta]
MAFIRVSFLVEIFRPFPVAHCNGSVSALVVVGETAQDGGGVMGPVGHSIHSFDGASLATLLLPTLCQEDCFPEEEGALRNACQIAPEPIPAQLSLTVGGDVGLKSRLGSQYADSTGGADPAVSPMDAMAVKRSQMYGMGSSPYSQQQQGGAYPSQPYGSPASHRYPMGMQGRGQVGMGAMQKHRIRGHGHPTGCSSRRVNGVISPHVTVSGAGQGAKLSHPLWLCPSLEMPAQYGQQGMGAYGQQGQPPYFSQQQQQQQQQQQPATPTQPPYMQPRAPPQQVQQGSSSCFNTIPVKQTYDDLPLC